MNSTECFNDTLAFLLEIYVGRIQVQPPSFPIPWREEKIVTNIIRSNLDIEAKKSKGLFPPLLRKKKNKKV